jgi:uncharacterized protein YcnI
MIRFGRSANAAALAVGATAVAVFAVAGPAAAHVTISPGEAVQGDFSRIAFRVPTESDTAATTKVQVFLPENAPVASVSTMPVPGWTVLVQRRKVDPPVEAHGIKITEVVSSLTWTAGPGAGVKPGEFQEFPVSLGPLPEVDRMVFKALQTYSDGTVVRWIEEPPANGGEVPNPAPVLTLRPAGSGGSSDDGASDGGASDDGTSASSPQRSDGTARALGIAGLVAGGGGLILGGLAYARTRRRAADAGPG